MKKLFNPIYTLIPFWIVTPVFAADEPPKITGPEGIGKIVDGLLDYLYPVALFICLIFIIQGGYMWMIASGDPARVKQAQGTLTWAVLGLLITVVIFTILNGVIDFVSKQ